MVAPAQVRRLSAEFVGTFILVFAGCGAMVVDATTHQLGHLAVALSFGLVIMALIYTLGHISGAHFNPAVTLAFALTRQFPWARVAGYWVARRAGAAPPAAFLRASVGNPAPLGAPLPGGTRVQSVVWELLLSFVL